MYSITYKAVSNSGTTTRPVLSGLSADSACGAVRWLLGLTDHTILDLTVVTMRGELVAVDRGILSDTTPISFIRRHAGL
jgi:FAD/FMN-containing dehydrogenase